MNASRPSARSRQRGIALLLVIFAVTFLGLVVVGLMQLSQFSWDDSAMERGRFQARMLAESGVALAMHPDVQPGDPVLRRELPGGRRIDVRITSEGGRILASTLAEELFIETTRELFILWGLDASEAAVAAESLADWIDEDSEARPNGAENPYYAGLGYPEFPPNAPFTQLDQMLLVRGMDRVAKLQPSWRDYFTLHGDGTIDVNTAPPDLLEAFFDCTPDAALALAATRAGQDLLEDTEDDYRIESLDEARLLLGLSTDQWSRVEASVSLANAARRIESTGTVGDAYLYRLVVLTEGTDSSAPPVARMAQ